MGFNKDSLSWQVTPAEINMWCGDILAFPLHGPFATCYLALSLNCVQLASFPGLNAYFGSGLQSFVALGSYAQEGETVAT